MSVTHILTQHKFSQQCTSEMIVTPFFELHLPRRFLNNFIEVTACILYFP